MSKQLVGEAKRKADREKAREMVAKTLGPKDSPKILSLEELGMSMPSAGKKAIEATTEDKSTLSDSTATVVQKPKKSTVKKPTAAELGVGQVVGGRGKVRSENPAPSVAPVLSPPSQEQLNEWAVHETSHHVTDGFPLLRQVESILGTRWTDAKWGSEKMEPAAKFLARAIKALSRPPEVQRVSVAHQITRTETPTEIVLSGPRQTNGIEVTSVRVVPTPKISKPRGDGWNGYSSSAIFRWAGSQGWSKDDCLKVITALNLTGVGAGSLPTLLKAGKDGFRLPDMKPEHAKELNDAAGKTEPQTTFHVMSKK